MRKRLISAVAGLAVGFATAASAANFVTNGDFEGADLGPTSATFYADGGNSAAASWRLYNNAYALTETEVVDPSTAPLGGDQMLSLFTGGGSSGVFQVFGGAARYATVKVKVLSGTVALYLYSNSGQTQQGVAYSDGAVSGWQTLSLDTGAANSNEIVIYSYGGGAEFLVDNAYASDVAFSTGSPGPEPAAWAMMLMGFGGMGAVLRRRKATSAAA